MSFITTPYTSRAEGDTYFSGRLNTDCWDDASDADKDKALLQATRAMDRLNYRGEKTDADQELQFPRGGDLLVPDDIKAACAEEALALLEGKDPEMERESLSIKSQEFGKAKVGFDKSTGRPMNILNGIMSATAWSYILPYLRDPMTFFISRTS